MTSSFKLEFRLHSDSSSVMNDFFDQINIVHPNQAIGNNIVSSPDDYRRLTITVPSIDNCSVSFSVDNTREELLHHLTVYNCACSLNACVIVHGLNGKKLEISIICDNNATYDFLQSLETRLSKQLI